ncbi:hypothetical protein HAX54_024011 [Datura stramonium]|uniref:Uncharacterized protein n=1 Tax=Datura stramonium TaxID=4076 RepID=A0ABS8UZL7_DATST|nr:hypothetical protein [Datura stramonium]
MKKNNHLRNQFLPLYVIPLIVPSLYKNTFECRNFDRLISSEDNFDGTVVDDVIENILRTSEVGKNLTLKTHTVLLRGIKEGKNIECQLMSNHVKQSSRLDNFEQISDKRVLPATIKKSPNKFDSLENMETELCVDESVKRRGVALNADMEVADDVQVVSCASGKQDAPAQMRVVFSVKG